MEKGILLSGGGREELPAELTKNEEVFNQIAEYLFSEGGRLLGYNSVDDAKRDLMKNIKLLSKAKPSFGLRDLLEFMFETKEEVVASVKEKMAITEAIANHLKTQINEANEEIVFSGLGKFASVVDTVAGGNKPDKEIN